MSPTIYRIDINGFWLLVDNKEYFVSFDDYPSFKQARVEQVFAIEHQGLSQFYWPDLDVDIERMPHENCSEPAFQRRL